MSQNSGWGLNGGCQRGVDYCPRVGDHEYYKEVVGRAVDTSVRKNLLGRNHCGNSRRLGIGSDCPRVTVDYLGDSAAPLIDIGCCSDNDSALVGSRHLGNSHCPSSCLYSVVGGDRPGGRQGTCVLND